jgi:undecaprenyl-diphosphatase
VDGTPAHRRSALPVLLALAAGLLGFLLLGELVRAGATAAVDSWLVSALRRPEALGTPRGPIWWQSAARDLTSLGGNLVVGLVAMVAAGLLVSRRELERALFVLALWSSAAALARLLQLLYGRARPELVPQLIEVAAPSFPSSHAMVSAAVYLSWAMLLGSTQPRRSVRLYLLAAAIVVTALVGLTRVYLGVHYPTDVLAGWLAGALWALAGGLAARGLPQPRAREARCRQPPGL